MVTVGDTVRNEERANVVPAVGPSGTAMHLKRTHTQRPLALPPNHNRATGKGQPCLGPQRPRLPDCGAAAVTADTEPRGGPTHPDRVGCCQRTEGRSSREPVPRVVRFARTPLPPRLESAESRAVAPAQHEPALPTWTKPLRRHTDLSTLTPTPRCPLRGRGSATPALKHP